MFDSPKGDIFCVHPLGRLRRYVELRPVRMPTLVCHPDNAAPIVANGVVLIYVSETAPTSVVLTSYNIVQNNLPH